jgi:hypothetical protein
LSHEDQDSEAGEDFVAEVGMRARIMKESPGCLPIGREHAHRSIPVRSSELDGRVVRMEEPSRDTAAMGGRRALARRFRLRQIGVTARLAESLYVLWSMVRGSGW